MSQSRRGLLKWSASALGLAAFKPSGLQADIGDAFTGFGFIAAGRFQTRLSSAIKASPLSVGYEMLDRQRFDPARTCPHAAQLGEKWARCRVGGARTEQPPGRSDFGGRDQVVEPFQGRVAIGDNPKSPALLDPLSGRSDQIHAFDAWPLTDDPLIIANERICS